MIGFNGSMSSMVQRFNGFKDVFVFVFVFVILGTGCERRPLEEEWQAGGYAEILLMTDWKELNPYEIPTGLTALFYPTNGGNPVTVMSNNTVLNPVRLAQGTYQVLVFNQSIYEFGSMNFTGMDAFATATANLNPLSPGNTLTAADYKWLTQVLHTSDSVALGMRAPEYFHADRFEYEVTEELCKKQFYKENGIVGSDVPVWDIPEPEEYVDTIFSTPPPVPPTLYIKAHVKGINNAYQVRAYIDNMAAADRFGPHVNAEETALHVISNWAINIDPADKKRGTFTGSTRCFGVPTQIVTHNPFNDLAALAEPALSTVEGSSSSRSSSSEPALSTVEGSSLIKDYGRNILFIEVLLRDGKTHCTFAYDVTDCITYSEGELRLDLVLNINDYPGTSPDKADEEGKDYPIILPDVPDVIGSGGAGFDATVEDWKNEDHTIIF